jgi:hypothetical protein
MTSFALTHGGSDPSSVTRVIRGMASVNGRPAIAAATSSPPAPMASIPSPPQVGV